MINIKKCLAACCLLTATCTSSYAVNQKNAQVLYSYNYVQIINPLDNTPLKIKSNKYFYTNYSSVRQKTIEVKPGVSTLICFVHKPHKEGIPAHHPSDIELNLIVAHYSQKIKFNYNASNCRLKQLNGIKGNQVNWGYFSRIYTPAQESITKDKSSKYVLTDNMLLGTCWKREVIITSNVKSLKIKFSNKDTSKVIVIPDRINQNYLRLIKAIYPAISDFDYNLINSSSIISDLTALAPVIIRDFDTRVSLNVSIDQGISNKILKDVKTNISAEYDIIPELAKEQQDEHRSKTESEIDGFGKGTIKDIPIPGKYRNGTIENLKLKIELTAHDNSTNTHYFKIDNVNLKGFEYSKDNPPGIEGYINNGVYRMKIIYSPDNLKFEEK